MSAARTLRRARPAARPTRGEGPGCLAPALSPTCRDGNLCQESRSRSRWPSCGRNDARSWRTSFAQSWHGPTERARREGRHNRVSTAVHRCPSSDLLGGRPTDGNAFAWGQTSRKPRRGSSRSLFATPPADIALLLRSRPPHSVGGLLLFQAIFASHRGLAQDGHTDHQSPTQVPTRLSSMQILHPPFPTPCAPVSRSSPIRRTPNSLRYDNVEFVNPTLRTPWRRDWPAPRGWLQGAQASSKDKKRLELGATRFKHDKRHTATLLPTPSSHHSVYEKKISHVHR